MIRSRRLALVAATVVLGLTATACGDNSVETTTTESVVGATPPVIKLGAGAAPGGGGAMPANESTDRMMMPYAVFTYVFAGELPALDGTAPAWQFPVGVLPDLDRVAAIADLLGVEGDVRVMAADMGGGWMVGPDDYSAATLTVSADGMLSWWFSPAPMDMPAMECVEPALVDPVEGESSDGGADPATSDTPAPAPDEWRCPEPQPPVGVPDAPTAERQAMELFAAMGYDTSAMEFDVYADEWSANVTGWTVLDGARAPITVSVGFGAEGAVTWASGTLAEPVAVGDYPLVGTTAGLERLNDESGMWMAYGGPAMMARDAGVTVSSGSDVAVEPAIEPAVVAPDESMPVEEIVELEEIVITFTSVTLGLTQIWDADGSVWLLPAYVFTAADGGEWQVIAVDDSFIEMPPMPEPLPIEPMPEPMPVDTVVSEPGDGTDPGELPAPLDPAVVEVLVGLTTDEAATVAAENGWGYREVRVDGVDLPVTEDYSPTRVNVELAGGVVTAIVSIG